MSNEEQLNWEARWAKVAALAAALAVILSVGAQIYVSSQLESTPDADHTRVLLSLIDSQSGIFITGAVMGAIGGLLLAVVLWYLFNATRARSPELPKVSLVLAFVGPVLLAVAAVLGQIDLIDRAREFVASGPQSEVRADDLLSGRPALVQSIGLSGALSVAFATVMISRNAMRVGLLTRFMGVLGIIVGALYVIGLLFPLGTDLIRMLWLVALALLFLGWWPGGRGPAWETGEAIEWPSAAARRALLEQDAPGMGEEAAPVALPQVNGNGNGGEGRTRSSRKRKKKRR